MKGKPMYNQPLAPHEIDKLQESGRVKATIEQAKATVESAMQDDLDKLGEDFDELRRAAVDLWNELNDLMAALESEDSEQIELAIVIADKALERHNEYAA